MARRTVRLVVQVSGTRNGASWPPPGETITVDSDEADGLVRAGLAVETKKPRAKKSSLVIA